MDEGGSTMVDLESERSEGWDESVGSVEGRIDADTDGVDDGGDGGGGEGGASGREGNGGRNGN